YGGFLGGAMGFYCFLWRNRLPTRLFSDLTIVGLLIAFSIGRIACTVVSDHIGALVPPDAWYAPLAMEYPTNLNLDAIQYLLAQHPEVAGQPTLLAWNLGFIELLYLIPVNALILFLAFRSSKRMPAGFITALTGVLYAPVRFFLDYLRPPNSDPRHFGFTFAQWASILAFGAAVYLAMRILRNGKPAETFGTTSGEVQAKRRMELKEDAEVVAKAASTKKGSSPSAKGASVAKQAGSAKASGMTKEVSQTPQTPDERKAALLAQIKREKPPAGDVKDETAAVKSTSKALADDKPQTPKTENTASGSEKSSSNWEQPADEGAVIDPTEAAEAGKAESENPSTATTKK
ncbi:MAG TPA: prolipoprotein diacylglyceryl transferase family protein, partial [Kofleriaceae bacterium]|nr:prolipoprotein diacylglyceryl transferase family protein [Kofleriaceae bacterium]